MYCAMPVTVIQFGANFDNTIIVQYTQITQIIIQYINFLYMIDGSFREKDRNFLFSGLQNCSRISS